MQRYWLFLLIAMVLSLPGGRAAAREPASVSGYGSLEKMDIAARTAWVTTMLGRLDAANRVVLDPAAVAKQHARFEQMLDAFVKGLPTGQTQVQRFEEELALSQRAAIEHLTRRYRIDSYDVFRNNRSQYEQRLVLLERLIGRKRISGVALAQQHKIIDWLVVATEPSTDRRADRLPPLPIFADDQRARPIERSIARTGSPAMKPSARTTLPKVELTSASAPRLAARPPLGLHPADFLASRARASTGENVVQPPVLHTSPKVELPLGVHRSTPRPHHVAMRPSLEPVGFAASNKLAMAASSSSSFWRRAPSVAGVTRPISKPGPLIENRSAPTSHRSSDPLAFARTKIDRLAMASPRRSPTEAQSRSAATSVPSSPPRPSEVSSTGSLDGSSLVSVALGNPSGMNLMSRMRLSDDSDEPDELPLPNADELVARIRGNNMALRKLAAELYEDRNWDANSLARILDELTPLVSRVDDLRLIRELIPPQQRDQIGNLELGSDLISDLGTKIARARSQVEESRSHGGLDEHRAELKLLDQLSQKLARLVFNE
ncbi:MAG: hypothetical protein JW888_13885 [Pirellulales bacterium]|nr:hypothetical protein [Pirellulales bacterium]